MEVDDQVGEVTVSIPTDKVEKLQKATSDFLKRPVVGRKQLRSYAGGLSSVAGLIPHLRPFLATIWAVLGGVEERMTEPISGLPESYSTPEGYGPRSCGSEPSSKASQPR